MRYIFTSLCALLLIPSFAFAQANLSVSGAVQTETSQSGHVRFSYHIQEDSQLILRTECTSGKFFVEETGAIITCGESYTVPNAGDGGQVEVIPYEMSRDTNVTYVISQKKSDGTTEEISRDEVAVVARAPQPLFSQVSVRQPDPTEPRVAVAWETLARANVSLYLECDSESLKLTDSSGTTYACNQKIASWQNEEKAESIFTATGHSTTEGLLFVFTAEQDNTIGARQNISFTFETTTKQTTEEIDQNVIERLVAQVKALLQVVASLFR